ncbi:alpha/beta fold hydrolase [Halomonas halocynthiae]|uniref:alpha/beta fold hydrolase n=1 Tax=Halomonas halocynthiae TaxID=176290 RepID=UPI0004149B42|nr:alpha/beta hydrolase [Halomonas halocynthiae]
MPHCANDPREPLLFSHANGFPGRSYRSFLAPLESRFTIYAVDKLGHSQNFQVGHNWLALRDELLTHLADIPTPVVGVGHSMGGVLMSMAALAAPQHFRCVVMLDPPLMLGIDAKAMRLAKLMKLTDRVTPAGRSKGRRAQWSSREAMRDYLKSRGLFRRFTDQALDDYLEGASTSLANGERVLTYEPEIEVEIFRHLPHHLSRLPKRISVPLGLLAGQESELLTPRRCRKIMASGIALEKVPGGHMFPMEYPEETRSALLKMIDKLTSEHGVAAKQDASA